ncbi:Hypothetical protein A7982_08749 [Minicystis rosea]|nr:Hypothetical protein A7982_08749 [Minicystis rosea]
MTILAALRRSTFAALTLALGAAAAPGCGSETGSNVDDVTDVKNSSVKNQSIGNCWVYATMGWAESLHLAQTAEELNLSESWISYWHWYEAIAGAPPGLSSIAKLDTNGQLATGGWFGLAAELVRRYGVIKEGSFIPEEAEAARSSRQSSALNIINASLKSGVLSDPAKRKDRKLVRQELDKAWGLSAATTALVTEIFGADVKRTILDTSTKIPTNSGMMYPRDILVGHNISLADAIGQPVSSSNVLQRKGKYAWNEVAYPTGSTSRRDVLRRMQKAMHSGMPVILSWFVDFNAMNKQNQFLAPPATPGSGGGHMTVVEDYQVSNVPGFGTLAAGTLVTDPKALDAALSPSATIDFLRIKNSWGTSLAPPNSSPDLRGYYDLYMKYLDAQLVKCTASGTDKCGSKTNVPGLTALILPPDAFVTDAVVKEGSCNADLCVAGPALNSKTCEANPDKQACVDLICETDSFCCNNEWDAQCVSQVVDGCGIACP